MGGQQMKRACAVIVLVVSVVVLALGFADGFKSIKELLSGSEEVPLDVVKLQFAW